MPKVVLASSIWVSHPNKRVENPRRSVIQEGQKPLKSPWNFFFFSFFKPIQKKQHILFAFNSGAREIWITIKSENSVYLILLLFF